MPRPDLVKGHDHELRPSDHYAAEAINKNVQKKQSAVRREGWRDAYNAHLATVLASGRKHPVHGIIFAGHPKYNEAEEM